MSLYLRRVAVLSLAASALLSACSGGGDSGGNGTGLGSDDTLTITSVSPPSAPASATQPMTFTVSYSYDLETTSSATVTAGYQLAPGSLVFTTSTKEITSKGPGTGTLTFSLPASALLSSDLGVVADLSDTSSGAVLAEDIFLVPRTQ